MQSLRIGSEIVRLVTLLMLATFLLATAVVWAHAESADHMAMGHQAELHRTSHGVYYEGMRLPIDPTVKTIFALILLVLTLVAFTSIMIGIGRRGRTQRMENAAVWVHRVNGWAFILLAAFIAQYCIRILGVYGHLSEPAVVLHMATAFVVLLIPTMKFFISRFFRDQNNLLPYMGVSLLLLTWVMAWTVIIHYFRG